LKTSSKKGYALIMALYFIIISAITSVVIYAYSYHISKEVSVSEVDYQKGYYAAVSALRYMSILLKDPHGNFDFSDTGGPNSVTRTMCRDYPGPASALGLRQPPDDYGGFEPSPPEENYVRDITIVLTKRPDKKYDASATYSTPSGDVARISTIISPASGGVIGGMKVSSPGGASDGSGLGNLTQMLDMWTVPAGVTNVTVELLGGGGAGSYWGSGGGAGGYIKMLIPVDSGTTLGLQVGFRKSAAGGTGNFTRLTYTNTAGKTLTATANGGGGGGDSIAIGGANGGTSSVTTTIPNVAYLSTKGADSELYHVNRGSGDGASSIYGGGGRGQTSVISEDGDYGAGGGGYFNSSSYAGGPGLAIIYW
jgi:hypothetical protein